MDLSDGSFCSLAILSQAEGYFFNELLILTGDSDNPHWFPDSILIRPYSKALSIRITYYLIRCPQKVCLWSTVVSDRQTTELLS